MTMNTRQAGAFTELIKKEEAARERWNATHGQAFNQTANRTNGLQASQTARGATNGAVPITNAQVSPYNYNNATGSFGGSSVRPMSARPSIQGRGYGNTQQQGQSGQFTASGRPHEVFQNAVAVGEPRLVDQNDKDFVQPKTVTKRVIRQVEVPTVRQVKVPVRTTQIVNVMVPRKVRTVALVEEDAVTEREEEYEDTELVQSTRQREVLVPRYVTEPYTREVKVKKVRKVPTPVKRFREVEQWTTVDVPEQKAIQVDGVRIDEVNETKLVEVEEFHTYELKPVPTGRAEVIATKEIGTGRRLSGRRTGRDLFHAQDPALSHLPHDSARDYNGSVPRGSSVRPQSAGPSYASQRFSQPQPLLTGASTDSRRLGFKVRTSTTTPGTCAVFEVEPGQLASRSGLKQGDIILSANGRQTNSLQDFKNSVGTSKGPLLLQIKRGTDRFVITLQR